MDNKSSILWYADGLSWGYRLRHFFYGLIFLFYIWFIHPLLLASLVQARTANQTFLLIGFSIILVQVLEPVGVWLKGPAVQERIRRWPSDSFAANFSVGVSQLTHIFLSMMVFLYVMPLFGIEGMCFDYDTRALPCLLTNLAFVAILGKEMVVFFLVLNIQKPAEPLDLEAPGVKLREMLGEPMLLSFGTLNFTFSWSAIMTFIEPVTADAWWLSLLASLILFLMLYPPSRLVFFAEEWLVKQSLLNRIITIGFFIMTLIAALQEVPGLLV